MLFYEIIGEDGRRVYASSLADAHKLAKCRRPYSLVTIGVVKIDTSKAGVQRLLVTIFSGEPPPVFQPTRKRYKLTPRGGLKLVE